MKIEERPAKVEADPEVMRPQAEEHRGLLIIAGNWPRGRNDALSGPPKEPAATLCGLAARCLGERTFLFSFTFHRVFGIV